MDIPGKMYTPMMQLKLRKALPQHKYIQCQVEHGARSQGELLPWPCWLRSLDLVGYAAST